MQTPTSFGSRTYTSVPSKSLSVHLGLLRVQSNIPQPSNDTNSSDPPKYLRNRIHKPISSHPPHTAHTNSRRKNIAHGQPNANAGVLPGPSTAPRAADLLRDRRAHALRARAHRAQRAEPRVLHARRVALVRERKEVRGRADLRREQPAACARVSWLPGADAGGRTHLGLRSGCRRRGRRRRSSRGSGARCARRRVCARSRTWPAAVLGPGGGGVSVGGTHIFE